MKKILLLDDNPDSLQVAADVLKYDHYEVETASKCTGFIELTKTYQPDLLIIDYRLDDGNGGELCNQIKSDELLNHIPIILFSSDYAARLELLDYGCDAIIEKPFDLVSFLTTVRKLANKA